jgi:peptidyl-prolyl cis-trans isomerase C
LEQSFVAGIETLKPSGYSRKPVKTQYGWHVIQLHGARFLDKPPFEKAQEWLRQEILHEKVNGRIAQLKREARIEVPKLQ